MGRHRAVLGLFACACAWLALGVPGCQHDYDALRDEYSPELRDAGGSGHGGGGSGGSSGTGGSTGGSGGAGGTGGTGGTGGSGGAGGTGGSGGTPGDACEPCGELSDGAMELDLVSCCASDTACGLAVEEGEACFPLAAPGLTDAACPAIGAASARREGCCRVDGRCGVLVEDLGLGCLAREDLPDAIARRGEPMPCQVECEADEDCDGLPDVETLCVPERGQADARYCAERCQRDAACAEDLVCALSPDIEEDRLIAFCQTPYGDREPGEPCDVANQCIHGACLRLEGETEALCTQFCESDADCPSERRFCVPSRITRPSGSGTPISFDVCATRDN